MANVLNKRMHTCLFGTLEYFKSLNLILSALLQYYRQPKQIKENLVAGTLIDEQRGFLRHLSASGRQFTGGYPKSRIWWDDEKKERLRGRRKED